MYNSLFLEGYFNETLGYAVY